MIFFAPAYSFFFFFLLVKHLHYFFFGVFFFRRVVRLLARQLVYIPQQVGHNADIFFKS